jgi:hypothetical protein
VETTRLWIERENRWRAELDSPSQHGTQIVDGDRWYSSGAHAQPKRSRERGLGSLVASIAGFGVRRHIPRRQHAPMPPFYGLFHARTALLGTARVAAGTGVHAGRRVEVFHAESEAPTALPLPRGADHFEFALDTEHNAVLFAAAFANGEELGRIEVLEIAFPSRIDPERFVFPSR